MRAKEFQKYVDDLLQDKELIDRITDYPSHRLSDHTLKSGNSRLDHCLRVSFMCYKFAKILRLNKKRCTRAGFLHDCGYGTNESPGKQVLRHSFYSAEIA
ncbi:MAG: HD domain-containing protein, partial [Asgard group archaeon]